MQTPARLPYALRAGLPLLILAVPSCWLLITVPPLWRDVDAYVQTVYAPNANTILLHGPLYCTLSRLPLWIGYLICGAGPAVSFGHFVDHTKLSDAGIFALIGLQHLGLWCAALYLIDAIATRLVTRMLLAAFFASQPLFYTFAHCVGSETLSLILTIFLVGKALRLALRSPDILPRDWMFFTALLCCCILTRQVNRMLAGLLPITFGIVAISRARDRAGKTRWLRPLIISVIAGIVALVWSATLIHLLCWRARTPWRPKFGYTFMWRLNFLQPMQPPARRVLLDTVASRCKLPESRRFLNAAAIWFAANSEWDPADFARETTARISAETPNFTEERFDRVLNDVARAFLVPPVVPLRSAAIADIVISTRRSGTDVARNLFLLTDFVFDNLRGMPQASQLRTFRQRRETILQLRELRYFSCWSVVTFRGWSILAVIALVFGMIANVRSCGVHTPAIAFAVSLAATGAMMLLTNCFFVRFEERFILTSMEFLIISFTLLLSIAARPVLQLATQPR